MEKGKEIFVSLKQVIMGVALRNKSLTSCCPSLNADDEEMQGHLHELAQSQQQLELAVTGLRLETDDRLADFSDAEVLLLVHLWSGLWANDGALRVSSSYLTEIVGSNQIEELGELVTSLLSRTSRLLQFIYIRWEPGRRSLGEYIYQVHDLDALHRLILGDLHQVKE